MNELETKQFTEFVERSADDVIALRARVVKLEAVLVRCKTVLGNMAQENEGAIFNRWPISHEPLRNDARNLLPVIDTALAQESGK